MPKEHVHVLICDNVANMVKEFECVELSSLGCSLHMLQLAINDCIFNQKSVSDAVATCRRLLGHLKHSTQASQHLTDIQLELSCDKLCPLQDVSTRWNSSFYMIDCLLKIKRLVTLFCAETDGLQNETLPSNMWNLLECVKGLLEPIENLTGSQFVCCISVFTDTSCFGLASGTAVAQS